MEAFEAAKLSESRHQDVKPNEQQKQNSDSASKGQDAAAVWFTRFPPFPGTAQVAGKERAGEGEEREEGRDSR